MSDQIAPPNLNALAAERGLSIRAASAGTVAARLSNVHGIMNGLRRIVPEFRPAYHFSAAPPHVFKRMRPDVFPAAKPGKASGNVTRLNPTPVPTHPERSASQTPSLP